MAADGSRRRALFIPRCYHPLMKVAISVPDPVFEAAERLAAALKMPRSRIYAEALAAYVGSHASRDITARLNEVYAREPSALDPELTAMQRASLPHEAW